MKVKKGKKNIQVSFTDHETNQPLLPNFTMSLSKQKAHKLAHGLLEALGQNVDEIDRMRFAHEIIKQEGEGNSAELIIAAIAAWEERITKGSK